MKLWRRLQQLKRQAVDAGFPECRDRRGRIVLRTAKRLSDGSVVAVEEESQPCARCERVAEQIIEVVETVVDVRAGCPKLMRRLESPAVPFASSKDASILVLE